MICLFTLFIHQIREPPLPDNCHVHVKYCGSLTLKTVVFLKIIIIEGGAAMNFMCFGGSLSPRGSKSRSRVFIPFSRPKTEGGQIIVIDSSWILTYLQKSPDQQMTICGLLWPVNHNSCLFIHLKKAKKGQGVKFGSLIA